MMQPIIDRTTTPPKGNNSRITAMYQRSTKELIICPECKGEAYCSYTEQRGPIIRGQVEQCRTCKGSGRAYLITNISIEPFTQKQL